MPLTASDLRSANMPCIYLLCSSIIVLIAASLNCTNYNKWGYAYYGNGNGNPVNLCTQENAWAVACSAISTGLTLIFIIISLINSGA